MSGIPLRETIATPRSLAQLLGPRHESVARAIANAPVTGKRSKKKQWDEAAAMAALGLAMRELDAAAQLDGQDVFVAPGNPLASLLQSYLSEQAAATGKVRPLAGGGHEIKFEEGLGGGDAAGWGGVLPHWIAGKLLGGAHRVLRPKAGVPPTPIANTARVAVLGDWGTGLYGAPVSAGTIDQDPRDIAVTLHLGDIYYSGTEQEVRSRFLDLWPARRGRSTLRRALNGNHEMYSGGHAYFDDVLPAFAQPSSYFALQNDHWTLVGLDTAHLGPGKDHDLDAPQTRWVNDVVAQAAGRKVVLFSHHQLFSILSGQGPKLRARLKTVLEGRRVFAWYWGHEHRCVLYDRDANGMLGRCVGHSGIPYVRKNVNGATVVHQSNGYLLRELAATADAPRGRILDGPNLWVKGKEQAYGPNGHLFLEFDGPHLNEVVCAPDGTMIWEAALA